MGTCPKLSHDQNIFSYLIHWTQCHWRIVKQVKQLYYQEYYRSRCDAAKFTDVSEERNAYIFRVEEKAKHEAEPENKGSTFLKNVSKILQDYTASHPARQPQLRGPQMQ
jgi:ABC-type bacteriocin/lantibiotic exporter with double-glycine peptidase domain